MTTVVPVDIVTVRTHGRVTADEVAYARSKIVAVTRYVHGPVLLARVKLTRLADPAVPRRAVVQANLDLSGRLLRAQAARPTIREAVDEVHDRLRDRLVRASGRWEATHGRSAMQRAQSRRRHELAALSAAPLASRAEPAQIVRRKTFPLRRRTVDEAAEEMQMRDYDFHLFVEEGSGADSVLYRPQRGRGLRLSQVDPAPRDVVRGAVPVTVSTARPPTLTPESAMTEIANLGWPFLFYRDYESGRGCVLYHRFDRHFGVIAPPALRPTSAFGRQRS
jgi:ribosome-associated translation inhibitor RaiA